MNPERPSPQFPPERTPVQPVQGQEYLPTLPTPEQAGERSMEREQAMAAVDLAPQPVQQPAVSLPQPVPVTPAATPAPVANDNPIAANDDDLIEKEWVDKAKKIITETRNDPYRREQEVTKLQADYLFKRYGKELGVAD